MTATHVGTEIERPVDEVTAFVRNPANLPLWAAGLASGIQERDGVWVAQSPMGRVTVAFGREDPSGVCDHDVTLPDGSTVTNPMRIIDDGPRCQVVFTVRGDDTAADGSLVAADLERLKGLLERSPGQPT